MSNRTAPSKKGTWPAGWVEVGLDEHRIPARRYENLAAYVIGGGWAVAHVFDLPHQPAALRYVQVVDDPRKKEPWWYLAEVRFVFGRSTQLATDWSTFPVTQLDLLATTDDFVEVLTATLPVSATDLLERIHEVCRLPLRPLPARPWLENLPAVYAASDPRDRGTSFYLHVAEAYKQVIARGGKPAPEIAALLDLPATTVYRWIGEARALGYLSPGRREGQSTRPARSYVR